MTVYEYLVKVNDKASPSMQKIARAAGTTDSNMQRLTRAADGSGASMRRVAASSGVLQNSLVSLRGTLAATFAVASIGAFSLGIIKAGSDLEQTKISFDVMLGSAQKAAKVLGDLNQFANVTPFTNDEVVQSGKSLLAFQLDAQKLIPTLKSIGDVASGLKIPFNELSDIYGKIMVSQTVYGDNLNQLAGRGIPIFKELAAVMGVQESQIKKLASQGKIGFAQIEQAFINMTSEGGAFFDMMKMQAKSFGGLWSTLVGTINAKKMEIGLQLTEQLKPALQLMIDMITPGTALNQTMMSLGGTLMDIAHVTGIAAGSWLAYVAVGKVTIAVETIKYLWMMRSVVAQTLLTSSTGALAAVSATLNAVWLANPIGIVIGGIVALGGVIWWAYNRFETFRAVISGVWETAKYAFGSISRMVSVELLGAWNLIKQVWTGISDLASNIWTSVNSVFERIAQRFNELFGGMIDVISGIWKTLTQGISMPGVSNFGKSFGEAFQRGYNNALGSGTSPIENLMSVGNQSKNQIINPDKTNDSNSNADKGIDNITAGGGKSVTVNFQGGIKFAETIEINPQTIAEGLNELEPQMREFWVRLLKGGLQTI